MNPQKMTLVIFAALLASLARADDFKTLNGKEYKNATVTRVEPDGIMLRTKSGISKVYFVELPHDVRERFGYRDPAEVDAECVAKVAKEWRRNEHENAEAAERAREHANKSAEKYAQQRAKQHERIRREERAEKERSDKHTQERASKERNAQAILKKTTEEFQTAEYRAAQSDGDGAKATLSGQVFIATQGGENVKLGARKVSLFDRDALVILATGVRAFADAKSEKLKFEIAAAQERIAVQQKQIKTAEEEIAAAHEEEQEEEQEANAAAEQAEAAWNTPLCQEDLANAAVKRAILEQQQGMEAAEQAESAARLATWVGDQVQAKETARQDRQFAQRAREAEERAREAAERAKQYRLNKASDAADAAREAVRAAWEAADAPKKAAEAAEETVEAVKAEIESLQAEEAYYYSDEFLFSQLQKLAIVSAETDAEGKFTMKAPRKGKYVITAEGWRLIWDKTESYYWLQPISLNGQDEVVQNLSNTNLGGAIGIASLLGASN